MSEKTSFGAQFSIALLVTGNLIGAGILGIPVIAGICGVLPAFFGMVVFCLAMYYTACVIADETMACRSATFNYPSLYHKYLGGAGKWVAALANMLILYGLLTAYLAGGGTILASILNIQAHFAINIVFFLVLTSLTVAGISIIRRCNAGLIALLWGSFLVIVVLGAFHIDPGHYRHTYWAFLPVAVPVTVTAFHFHNIIPNVAEALGYDRGAIRRSMLAGLLIGFLMNLIWLLVGTGVVPLAGAPDSLINCHQHNIPATIPMAHLIGSRYFMLFAMIFSVIAIVTSYVANGLGLMGFCRDLLENYLHVKSRWVCIAVTFLPPLVISLINPEIFLKAINFVGGYGIVVLFGVLPAIIACMKASGAPRRRMLALGILLLFGLVLLSQMAMDAKLLTIQLPVSTQMEGT